ncbi:MAG: hypothetical protein EA343_13490 [Nodularia sp. (in: Bacteria)]|nr:MAG: hypothetical protein EA343_13490 [Nodularia sp. (in: cyanobacteria)]
MLCKPYSHCIVNETNVQFLHHFKLTNSPQGVNGQSLAVVTVWLESKDQQNFRFITLKPNKD